MSNVANKRSIMTLFSGKSDVFSHQVKIVLAEKGVPFALEELESASDSEDLISLNPYGTLPTLVDRELTLYNSRIIMEYLDERFPHPPLMPVYPVSRGQTRLYMLRIEQDWYPILDKAENAKTEAEQNKALKQLTDEILALAPVFNHTEFFMSEEFSLVDCYMAALLWKMKVLGVEFTGAGSKAVRSYMSRVFNRDSFFLSVGNLAKDLLDDK